MRHVIERAALQVILTSLRFVDNADAPFEELERFFVFLENLRREQFTFRRKLGAALRARRNADVLARQYKLGRIGADDPAVILFTSGSETLPKGVPLTHANLMENMKATVSEAHVTSRERMYGFLPPFHSFGINATALTPLLAGVRVAHYPNPTDARRIAFGIQRYGITLVAGTPTFLRGIVQAARPGQLDTVNLFVAGAEKAPAELQELVAALGTNARLREGYGITECSPIVSLARPYETPVGVGRPLPNVDMQIVNVETHAPLPQGETGMILVSGPSIFSGYIGDDVPDPFVELDGKRWYVTGDLGYLDRDGNLTIAGRLKRFVKIGGEMISLPALEDVLTTRWPGTDEGPRVAVASREREGERPLICAFTTLDTDVDEINSVLRDSGFSALARVHRVRKLDAIPLLGTGKVDYRHLQELID
jgi:long-chain-fatty-acid--[acyl-carrier-protein] ligase